MRKEATIKSRCSAFAGIFCVVAAYVVEGWLSPPLPGSLSFGLVAAAIGFLFLARKIREKDGGELRIPEPIRRRLQKLFNAEAYVALASGFSTVGVFMAVQAGVPNNILRSFITFSLFLFAINVVVNIYVNRRYHRMLNEFDRIGTIV